MNNPLKSLGHWQVERKSVTAGEATDNVYLLQKRRRVRIALGITTVLLLTTLMAVHFNSNYSALRLGVICPVEIRAGRSVSYVDTTRTHYLQQAAAQAIAPVYIRDPHAVQAAHHTVRQLFDEMSTERRALMTRMPVRRRSLAKAMAGSQFSSLLSPAALHHMLTVPSPVLQHVRSETAEIVDSAMQREIRNNGSDLRESLNDADQALSNALPSPLDQALARCVAAQALRPNRIYDQLRTQQARAAAVRSQPPDVERVLAGDRILAPGEIVTQRALDELHALGLISQSQEVTTTIADSLLAALMVLLVLVYLARKLPTLFADTRRMALLATISLLSMVSLKMGGMLFGLQVSGGQLGYLSMTSVTAASMLVCVLLDSNLALLMAALLSVQSGLLLNNEIRYTVMTLLSGLVGVICANSARRRSNLPLVATALAAANVGLVWLLGLLFSDTLPELLHNSMWAVGAAAMSLFLYWTGAMLLERPFGILTHSTLLELSSFDSPLLQRLCAVAPGTYAHSILVGTLAEAAAQAIDADSLLCRVAGYYHDIGKMTHPEFFVENQRHDNVHSRLSPSLSTLMIIGHVREGLVMAREAKLPVEIQDIIAQHHGTTLIQYFYHKALADNSAACALQPGMEQRFRYPGPNPQTAEAAIVMLADTVEAATRSVDKPDREHLEQLIASLVRAKIEDGQLDECPLTFRDTRLISEAFQHVLCAMMHGRIAYPGQKEAAVRKTAAGKGKTRSSQSLAPEAAQDIQSHLEALSSDTANVYAIQGELPAPEASPEISLSDPDFLYGNYDLQSAYTQSSHKTPQKRPAPPPR